MTITLECISIVIPIATIIKQIGLDGFHRHLGENTIHDDYLYRVGAMNQNDVSQIIEYWEKQGLKPTGRGKGKLYWKDLCVVDIHGPTLPCDWIDYDPEANAVRYRGNDGMVRP